MSVNSITGDLAASTPNTAVSLYQPVNGTPFTNYQLSNQIVPSSAVDANSNNKISPVDEAKRIHRLPMDFTHRTAANGDLYGS